MVHTRDHRSLLAGAEKRLLVRIARQLPASITSDHLTAMALISLIMAGVSFAFISRSPWLAAAFVAMLVVNWLGDSLDGTLARVRQQERPRYGYYVDHVTDLAGTAALLGGMAASGLMTPAIAFALLAGYLMVAAESFLGTHALGVFRMSFAGLGPTELRILLAIGAVRVALAPSVTIFGRPFMLLDVGGSIAVTGLAVAFVVSAVRNSRALYRTELLPPAAMVGTPLAFRFVIVGALGFVIQVALLGLLTFRFHWAWLPATLVAV
jgi:archaetidylinositol phosphate synthase